MKRRWKYAEHLTHMTLMTTYLSMHCPLTTGRSSYQKFCKPGYGLWRERRLLIIWFKSLTAISTEGQTTTCFKSTTQIINIVCLCLHFWDSANINLIFPNIYRLRLVKKCPKMISKSHFHTDSCCFLEFETAKASDGQRLINHVIRIDDVKGQLLRKLR